MTSQESSSSPSSSPRPLPAMIPILTSDRPNLPEGVNHAYVLAGNGIFVKKRTALYAAVVKTEGKFGHLPELAEGMEPLFKPLPWAMLCAITAFLKAIYAKFNGEGIVVLGYNCQAHEWTWIVPPQATKRGGLSVNYEADKVEMPAGFVPAGTVHSHCSAAAFQSGTDSADETHFDGLHITVGNLNTIPSYHIRFIAHGTTWKFDDIGRLVEPFNGPVSDELMARVTESTATQSVLFGGNHDYGDDDWGNWGEKDKAKVELVGASPGGRGDDGFGLGKVFDSVKKEWLPPYAVTQDWLQDGERRVFQGTTYIKKDGRWIFESRHSNESAEVTAADYRKFMRKHSKHRNGQGAKK